MHITRTAVGTPRLPAARLVLLRFETTDTSHIILLDYFRNAVGRIINSEGELSGFSCGTKSRIRRTRDVCDTAAADDELGMGSRPVGENFWGPRDG